MKNNAQSQKMTQNSIVHKGTDKIEKEWSVYRQISYARPYSSVNTIYIETYEIDKDIISYAWFFHFRTDILALINPQTKISK